MLAEALMHDATNYMLSQLVIFPIELTRVKWFLRELCR
jgi:hypothetical protein